MLTIWVIYWNPRDQPGKWVLRAQDTDRDGVKPHPEYVVCETLEQARACVPPGLVMMQRHPDDDPVIFEVWL
jgi:hypothetical protein